MDGPDRVTHPFPPLFDENSRILILGSFPSVKSREQMFFYGHPQNRFWKMLAAVFGEDVPASIEEKKRLVLSHHLALWDVIASCEIRGSSDSSIRNAQVNDFSQIFAGCRIDRILVNGSTAWQLYEKYARPVTGREALRMPSTSPANAAWSLERLVTAWEPELQTAACQSASGREWYTRE